MTQAALKTDHDLKTAIVDELAWTPGVNADRIGVSPDAGAVTLHGQVESTGLPSLPDHLPLSRRRPVLPRPAARIARHHLGMREPEGPS
jgi:hypothetical protein